MTREYQDETETVAVTIELDDETINRIADAVDAGDPEDNPLYVADRIHDNVDLDITAVDDEGRPVADLVA